MKMHLSISQAHTGPAFRLPTVVLVQGVRAARQGRGSASSCLPAAQLQDVASAHQSLAAGEQS